jgi:catechol 2,3-dioxygenase-like lactoylglutathione lyase family enzyme
MTKVVMRFGEVILKTAKYDALKSWYCRVLDAEPMMETERTAEAGPGGARQLCFIRLDADFPFFTTLGIFDMPGLRPPDGTVPGLHHFQVRFATIGNLFDRYEALAAHGIVPARSANHGPGTSFYYRDPDDNQLELAASNYLTEPEVRAFMQSEAFRRNVSGIDVDPAEYVGRYRRGVPLEELRLVPEPA